MSVEFFVIGVNHRTAGVGFRERWSLTSEQQLALMAQLRNGGVAHEAAVLCTCNRFELYGVSHSTLAKDRLLEILGETAGVPTMDAAPFYYHHAERALAHLFRVASSLDSQILGETHILGQVKDCYERSRQAGATAKWLNIFFQKSFQVAKRVRNETAITALPVSTGSCAVAVANRIFGDLAGCKVLLVGAGQIGDTVARHFSKHGVELTVSNRTSSAANSLSDELGATAVDFGQWYSFLPSADIAVFATSAREPLLTRAAAARITQLRKKRPLLLLDLSVPRNLDPAISKLESLFLYDLDGVQGLVDAHYAVRIKEAEKAERIITEWVNAAWSKTTSAAPSPNASVQQKMGIALLGPCPSLDRGIGTV